jgi:hypothetical protein
MTSRFKVLIPACLGAIFVLSAVGAGTAQAGKPVQPQFTNSNGETIKSNLTIEDSSGRSRLWDVQLGTVIRCEKDSSIGTIGPKGLNNEVMTYRECKVFSPKTNATEQVEEFEEEAVCKIKNGEIVTKPIKSHLVWLKSATEKRVLVLYQPEVGTEWFGLEIEGATCGIAGTLPVTGSVLSSPTRIGQPDQAEIQVFETLNGKKEVRQAYKEWEVEELNQTGKESGTAELSLNKKILALESIEQLELVKGGLKTTRGLFGITE